VETILQTIAPYHFQTVHFPIALTLASFFLLFLAFFKKRESLFNASRYVLYLATLGALAAMTTGLIAEEFLPHTHEGEIHGVMEWHKRLGIVIPSVLTLTSILFFWADKKQRTDLRKWVFILLAVCSVLVSTTGYFGGRLGHEFGIGIQKIQSSESKTDEVIPPSQPKEQQKQGHNHDDHEH